MDHDALNLHDASTDEIVGGPKSKTRLVGESNQAHITYISTFLAWRGSNLMFLENRVWQDEDPESTWTKIKSRRGLADVANCFMR